MKVSEHSAEACADGCRTTRMKTHTHQCDHWPSLRAGWEDHTSGRAWVCRRWHWQALSCTWGTGRRTHLQDRLQDNTRYKDIPAEPRASCSVAPVAQA